MILTRLVSMVTAALPVFIPAPAQAWLHHGTASAPVSCPQATDNGCAAAPAHGSFKNASLLTSAQQSGQNSLLPTRAGGALTLNIPGVDYGIGPDSTLTPQDPRTINDGFCAYAGTPPNDFVGCTAQFNGQVVTDTLNNYDFGGTKIGKSALSVYMGGSAGSNQQPGAGSKITFTNDYFAIPAGPANTSALGWGNTTSGNWSVAYYNNQCDGGLATATSGFCLSDDVDAAGTTVDIRYSVFSNQGVGRVMGGAHYATTTWKFNYVNGLNSLNTTNHGELELRSCSIGGCNTPSITYEGMFVVWDAQAPDPNDLNQGTYVISTGDTNRITFGAVNIINTISVVNTEGSPPTPTSGHRVGKALFGMLGSNLGDVTITGNWMDATGATACGISGVANGGTSVTASQTGNALTITGTSSSFNNNPIEIGWMAFHSGYTSTAITAFGTGGGNLGTYTVNGPSQNIGSDSAWTLVPGFNSFTASNNWNLADPSHVGTPTAVGFTAPTMTETTCLGAGN